MCGEGGCVCAHVCTSCAAVLVLSYDTVYFHIALHGWFGKLPDTHTHTHTYTHTHTHTHAHTDKLEREETAILKQRKPRSWFFSEIKIELTYMHAWRHSYDTYMYVCIYVYYKKNVCSCSFLFFSFVCVWVHARTRPSKKIYTQHIIRTNMHICTPNNPNTLRTYK